MRRRVADVVIAAAATAKVHWEFQRGTNVCTPLCASTTIGAPYENHHAKGAEVVKQATLPRLTTTAAYHNRLAMDSQSLVTFVLPPSQPILADVLLLLSKIHIRLAYYSYKLEGPAIVLYCVLIRMLTSSITWMSPLRLTPDFALSPSLSRLSSRSLLTALCAKEQG